MTEPPLEAKTLPIGVAFALLGLAINPLVWAVLGAVMALADL